MTRLWLMTSLMARRCSRDRLVSERLSRRAPRIDLWGFSDD